MIAKTQQAVLPTLWENRRTLRFFVSLCGFLGVLRVAGFPAVFDMFDCGSFLDRFLSYFYEQWSYFENIYQN